MLYYANRKQRHDQEKEGDTMDKATIVRILSMFPDEAEVEADFTFVENYNVTYHCYIEGVNLSVTPDNGLSAVLRLLEKKEPI